MRGRPNRQPNLFVQLNLEELVPADHPLRPIKRMADEALAAMSRTFSAAYAPAEKGGRPSIPPERLLKAMVLMSLYTVRSERALCERITFDMLFRWFLDMNPDEPCFDHSVLSLNRERLDRLDVTKKFSDRIVMMAMDAGLLSEDHFSIDGSLLQSHASLKSLKRIEREKAAAEKRDDDSNDAGGKVGNPWVDFRGEQRGNKTHRSVVDPEARLYTKTTGVAYLQHSMHVLMENRHGIGVDIRVGKADGYAERTCCLRMLDRVKRRLGIEPATLGADKGYDTEDFVLALEERGIEPHAACKSRKELDVPGVEADGAWARWFNQRRVGEKAFELSQRKRKLNEEIFGWLKQFGGLRRARLTGRWKIQQLADVALGTLNLIRMSKLLAT
ncbi:MAG: IS5 family transposase [Actinomycetales bacterium]|nr:IS5 family transposase [Actinomycetales bacterium]